MPDAFGVFILSRGRADRVITFETLRRGGFTGPIWILIDNEDSQADAYRARYGDAVIVFDKAAVAATCDSGDQLKDRRVVLFARNAVWSIARKLGLRYFVQFDDDYSRFYIKFRPDWSYKSIPITTRMDDAFAAMIEFLRATQAQTVCFAQGGDFIGGVPPTKPFTIGRRKAMNSFFCDTTRPFDFVGRVNEDVNTYVSGGRRGELFLTTMLVMLDQRQTQLNAGGMTDVYLDSGTYLKSFYSVMYCPSAVTIGVLRDPRGDHQRIHHEINWHNCATKIVRERWRKTSK